MASEDVYTTVIATLLEDIHIDAVIAAIVPLTPTLHTLAEEMDQVNRLGAENSIVEQIATLNAASSKPLIIVVDSGKLYDPMAEGFQNHGIPIFRSADIAVNVLGKYIHNRLQIINQVKPVDTF
jgi:acyl-CoA synthetase (NDP forming)